MHFIASLFEEQDAFPSFAEFKAPDDETKAKKFTDEDKERLLERSKAITERLHGGKK